MFIYLFYDAKVQRFIRMFASEITRKLSQIAHILLTLHPKPTNSIAMMYDIRNQIVYSTDFSQMNSPAYYGYVIHLLCLQGTATFIYNDKPF
jgi:hypothetical protein